MKKILTSFAAVTLLITSLTGSVEAAEVSKSDRQQIVYSNLVDYKTQKELLDHLKDQKIPFKARQNFLKDVNDFNRAVGNNTLVKSGYKTSANYHVAYDAVGIENRWDKKYPDDLGINCRITSFTLLKDFISVRNKSNADTEILAFDQYVMTNKKLKTFSTSEVKSFEKLFGAVRIGKKIDRQSQIDAITKYYQQNGIQFKQNKNISMVSVYLSSDLDDYYKVFIGHVGVLVKLTNNKYIFIEKLAFKEPYQAIEFKSKAQLKNYLTAYYKPYGDKKLPVPIIMENDHYLK